jgi:GAF domain-containing protein
MRPDISGSSQSPDDIMSAVAALATSAFRGCDAASITVVEDGHFHTATATDDDALAIDEQQYASDDGPCLQAIRTQKTIRVDSFVEDRRWQDVAAAALGRGKHSSLSLPLVTEGRAFGAMNLYASAERAFTESEEEAGKVFAAPAAVAIAGATSLTQATELAHHLALALEHRDVIGQAKGILMATTGVSSDAAFSMLRAASQRGNQKLYAVAEEIVLRRSKGQAD